MPCTSISAVITRLDEIVADAKQRQDKCGYFAVLYRKVTRRIQAGILAKEFEDNVRMEQLDVIFANRYLDAYDAWRNQKPLSKCWQQAFVGTSLSGTMVLQHLLAGINAHINLDLGIAAYQVSGAKGLNSLRKDFDHINQILSEMVDDVEKELAHISPVFQYLMPLAGKSDELVVNFSIQVAREGAWAFAQELMNAASAKDCIAQRDSKVAVLGRQLFRPGWTIRLVISAIALAEWRKVSVNLQSLEG